VGLLYAKGQLKVNTGLGYVCYLTEGGNHSLLLVVNCVPAGAAKDYHQQYYSSKYRTVSFLPPGGILTVFLGKPF
jgi:hypothetical protein